MKGSKRQIRLIAAIAIIALILITLFNAPTQTRQQWGSSYSRGPEGYGAWYSWMRAQGHPIERLRQPVEELLKNTDTPVTILQIFGQMVPDYLSEESVKTGHTFVLLGIQKPATAAPYESIINNIKIATTRRAKEEEDESLLEDDYGTIVWQKTVGTGKIIKSTTPYLAANAYQEFLPNYEFLAALVTQGEQPIWIDEYIHGYRDEEDGEEKTITSLGDYLQATSLFPVFIQLLIILLLAVVAFGRRFGLPVKIIPSKPNNTQAYIQALAGILEKANRSEYLVEILGNHEQRQLQKALGLGEKLVDDATLIQAWVAHTQQSPQILERILKIRADRKYLTPVAAQEWLTQWQKLHQKLLL